MPDTTGLTAMAILFLSLSVPDLMAPITTFVFAASLWSWIELEEQKGKIIWCKDIRKLQSKKKCNGPQKFPAVIGHPLNTAILPPPSVRVTRVRKTTIHS